jgi:hypothetical protein
LIGGKIDSGHIAFELAGWLGGYDSQQDHAKLGVVFMDGEYRETGRFDIAPVTAADRNNVMSLLYRSLTDHIPVGSRVAKVILSVERETGACDGYADNLSFKVLAP